MQSTLKTPLVKRMLFPLGSIVGSMLLAISLLFWNNQLERHVQTLDRDIQNNQTKVTNLQKQINDFDAASKLWETLSQKRKESNGLQFDEAKRLVENFKDRYRLSSLVIDLSQPEVLTGAFSTKSTHVVSTNAKISFDAITDAHAYNFVSAIVKEFPGYVQVNSFSVRRSSLVNQTIINDILAGDKPKIVHAELAFSWRDLKTIEKDDDKKKK